MILTCLCCPYGRGKNFCSFYIVISFDRDSDFYFFIVLSENIIPDWKKNRKTDGFVIFHCTHQNYIYTLSTFYVPRLQCSHAQTHTRGPMSHKAVPARNKCTWRPVPCSRAPQPCLEVDWHYSSHLGMLCFFVFRYSAYQDGS